MRGIAHKGLRSAVGLAGARTRLIGELAQGPIASTSTLSSYTRRGLDVRIRTVDIRPLVNNASSQVRRRASSLASSTALHLAHSDVRSARAKGKSRDLKSEISDDVATADGTTKNTFNLSQGESSTAKENASDAFFHDFVEFHNKRQWDVTQHYNAKRRLISTQHTPPENLFAELPPIMRLQSNDLVPLWLAIANRQREDAWSCFVVHVEQIHRARQSPHLCTRMFDSLFWLVASEAVEPDTSIERVEEIYHRINVMAEYADSSTRGLTTLQFRRLAFAFTTLCQRSDDAKYNITSLLDRFIVRAAELDSNQIEAIILLLTDRKQLLSAYNIVQTWQSAHASKTLPEVRRESWILDNAPLRNEKYDEILLEFKDAIRSEVWSSLLRCCLQCKDSHFSAARDIGWFVIRHADLVDMQSDVASYLTGFLAPSKHATLLPTAIQQLIAKVPRLNSRANVNGTDTSFPVPDEALRKKLFLPIAALQARIDNVKLAKLLLNTLEASQQSNATGAYTSLFSLAAEACSKRARQADEQHRSYEDIVLAIRFLEQCDRNTFSSDQLTLWPTIAALRKIVYAQMDKARCPFVSSEQWLDLARRMTVIVIRQDPTLKVFVTRDDWRSLEKLLDLHARLNDHTFAMRLFQFFEANFKNTTKSPFTQRNFLWLFQSVLFADQFDMRVAWQLLWHWAVSDLSSGNAPYLPTSTIRRFVQQMKTFSRGQIEQILLRQLKASVQVPAKHSALRPNQAGRLIAVLCDSRAEYQIDVVPLLRPILQSLRHSSTSVEHVVAAHSHVLQYLSMRLRRAQILQRAQCLDVFEGIRSFIKSRKKAVKAMGGWEDQINEIYLRVLNVLQRHLVSGRVHGEAAAVGQRDWNAECSRRIQELLEELETFWSIDLKKIDLPYFNAPITTARIMAYVGKGAWHEAYALYTQAMSAFAARQSEYSLFVDGAGEDEACEAPQRYWPVSVTVASRLALGMGNAGYFAEARETLALYLRSAESSSDDITDDSSGVSLEDKGAVTKERKRTLSSSSKRGRDTAAATAAAAAARRQTLLAAGLPAQKNFRLGQSSRLLLGAASVALLQMQGRTSEAFDRIYSLHRLGVFGAVPHSINVYDRVSVLPVPSRESQGKGRGGGDSNTFFGKSYEFQAAAAAMMPVPGPTNKVLSETFVRALEQVLPFVEQGDWQDHLKRTCKTLQESA